MKGSFFLLKPKLTIKTWSAGCRCRWHRLSVSQQQNISCSCSTSMFLQQSELKHAGQRTFMHEAEWNGSLPGRGGAECGPSCGLCAKSVGQQVKMLMLLWTKPCFLYFLNTVHMFLIFKPLWTFCRLSASLVSTWTFLTRRRKHWLSSVSSPPLCVLVWLYRCKHLKHYSLLVLFLSTVQKVCLTKCHLHHSVLSRQHSFIWLLSHWKPPSTKTQNLVSVSQFSLLFAEQKFQISFLCSKGENPSD